MLSTFFILSYATNSMSTDLVTIDKPVVVRSYDDVIDKDITSLMINQLPEYGKFKTAPTGSKEGKMFKKSEVFALGKYKTARFRGPTVHDFS